MVLAEYMRQAHPSPVKMYRCLPTATGPELTQVSKEVIKRGKAYVLFGFAIAFLLPNEYAAAVGFLTNVYWLLRL